MTKKVKPPVLADRRYLDRLISAPGFTSVSASIISIILGLILGFILLIIIDASSAAIGMADLLTYGFSSAGRIAKVLYKAAPLMLTGLSIGFAFRTGLFNIGATGQYTVGAFFGLFAAIIWKFPWWAAILVAMLVGAIWGAIPGFFNAYFNVNEVITAIMCNWIALFLCNLVFFNTPDMWVNASDRSRTVNVATANASGLLPKLGLDQLLGSSYANIGIFIAIIIAVLIYVILEKTTFGYELKACGLNKHASVYAGIKSKRNIVFAMMIAGGLAGIGGAISYLAGTVDFTISSTTLLPMGFNGIPVALLAFSNPLGIIASSIFIGFLQVGGEAMQPEFSAEMVNVILSVIIYFSAFSLIMRGVVTKLLKRKGSKEQNEDPEGPIDPTPVSETKGVEN
jgi:simple sugar transport system permease protein